MNGSENKEDINLENCLKALSQFESTCPKSPHYKHDSNMQTSDEHDAAARFLGAALEYIKLYRKSAANTNDGATKNIEDKIRELKQMCGNGIHAGTCGDVLYGYENLSAYLKDKFAKPKKEGE